MSVKLIKIWLCHVFPRTRQLSTAERLQRLASCLLVILANWCVYGLAQWKHPKLSPPPPKDNCADICCC